MTDVTHSWTGVANASTSTESVGGVVTRTNLASDPAAIRRGVNKGELGWTNSRWFGGGTQTGVYSSVTDALDGPLPQITTYLRKTWTVGGPATGDTGFNLSSSGTSGVPVIAGQTYSGSAYLRASTVHILGRMSAVFYDAGGIAISGTTITGPVVALNPGEWDREYVTFTTPATAAFIQMYADVDGTEGWAAGDTLDGTGLLLEASPTVNDYFDGASPTTTVPPYSGSLSLSGTGNLALAGSPYAVGTLTRTGTGTLTNAGSPTFQGVLDRSASGSLALAGNPYAAGALALTGSGTLTLSGYRIYKPRKATTNAPGSAATLTY